MSSFHFLAKEINLFISILFFSCISLSAQDLLDVVYLKNGSVIYCSVLDIVPDKSVKIQINGTNIISFDMDEVERITKESKNNKQPQYNKDIYGDSNLPDIYIENYKGFLLAKGNIAYIPDSEDEHEQYGVDRLRKLISEQGYWKLASRKEQAHFIIRYKVSYVGRDNINHEVLFRRNPFTHKESISKDYYMLLLNFFKINAGETKEENIDAAEEVFERLVKLQHGIDKGVPEYLNRLFMIK